MPKGRPSRGKDGKLSKSARPVKIKRVKEVIFDEDARKYAPHPSTLTVSTPTLHPRTHDARIPLLDEFPLEEEKSTNSKGTPR